MNTVTLSGRLTKNATVHGKHTKAVKFTIAAKYGYDKHGELVEFVPCVVFTPPNDKLGIFLAGQGKGVFVEFAGRVASATYKTKGETKYRTEVIVDKRSLTIVKQPAKQTA